MDLATLGLQSVDEAYYATKTALWIYLLGDWTLDGMGINPNLTGADKEAAERVLAATRDIYNRGMLWDKLVEPKMTATADQDVAYPVTINGESYYQQVLTLHSQTWPLEFVELSLTPGAPAGAKILPYRSNIPYLSKFCFAVCDETFAERAKAAGESIIVGGANYGQGSSREHAALVPLYLGVRAVIAKSFARIHAANLINAGIMPLTFQNAEDYDKLTQGDKLSISGVWEGMESGVMMLTDETTGVKIPVTCSFTERQKDILKAGGLLAYTRSNI
ncbi:MAG: hypothetical protein IKC59_05995 [Clostridia bacterium]|nr:hypothetical protein [Clostridia bacterium]